MPSSRLRLAEGLWRAAVVFLAVMPAGMAVAHRSSPAFLALSALCSLGAVAAEGGLRTWLREASSALLSPLGWAVLAFMAWCLVSIGWSEFRAVSLRAFSEFWLSVAAALVVGLTLIPRMTRPAFWLLTGAFVLACAMIVIELETGLVLRQALDVEANRFIFNRSVLTLLVLMPPLAAWLLGHVRHGWVYCLGLGMLLAAAVFRSDSGAAVLGLVAACLTCPLAWFAPRLAKGVMTAGLAAAMLVAPFIGPASDSLIPASMHRTMAGGHSRERVDLWISFGAAVREQFSLGGGFGVSPRIGDAAVARKVPRTQRTMLAIGHPHNAALQIWVELGAVGIFLALAVLLLIVRTAGRQPRVVRSMSFTLIAGAAAVALVGHGAWQGWWAASLGAAVIWMIAANGTRSETLP